MALYRDYYEIELSVNGEVIDLLPNAFSFSQTDSIHRIFSTGRVLLNDESGLLQEFLGTDQGLKVSLNYGLENNTNKNNYVVLGNTLEEPSTSQYITGEVDIPLKHEWFNYQTRESKSYSDRISAVIESLISEYNFNKTDINSTQNKDNWYRVFKTQAELIKDVLLPRAYSTNAKGTPFYAYITNDNVFHLRTLASMYQETPVATYIYNPLEASRKNSDFDKFYSINDIVKWQSEWDSETKNLRHRNMYYVNNDGSVTLEAEETLKDHIGGRGRHIPILNDRENVTGVDTFYFKDTQDDNTKGKINNAFRDNLFIDRFLITVPLNPELKSGQKITVEFKRQDEDGTADSERYSGNYIIEMCTHSWDKQNSLGETQLMVGRSSLNIPSNYLFSSRAMQ